MQRREFLRFLAVYRGTTDYSKCNSWPDYNEWKDYTVDNDSGLDVMLCLSMVYPDDIGYAKQYECLVESGSVDHPSFKNIDSCSGSNAEVTGRTSTYDDPSFCGSSNSVWWQNPDYPSLGYTVCWTWK